MECLAQRNKIKLITILFSLEECMEYIQGDEAIEVTPNFIRMRKKILSENERKRIERGAKS